MQLWKMAINTDLKKTALIIFVTWKRKAREIGPEVKLRNLATDDGMEKLFEKLGTLFKEDAIPSAFTVYEIFEK